MDDIARSYKVKHRIEEICKNGASLPDNLKDGKHYCTYDLRDGIIFHRCYKIEIESDNKGEIIGKVTLVYIEDWSKDRHLVRLEKAGERNPEIGIGKEFRIRKDGQIFGLDNEIVRKIFSWEFI